MNVTKCDLCKKVIKTREGIISAGIGYWPSAQLCLSCGKPVKDFLIKKELIKNETRGHEIKGQIGQSNKKTFTERVS